MTNQQKINGEMAVRRLSEKAQAVYNTTDPLVVQEYEQWDDTFYSIEGAFGDYYDLTLDELEEKLESFGDENEYFYAILKDSEDTDWGTGSFDLNEAVKMAVEQDCELVAVIKGDFVNGQPTTDPICVEELKKGDDFCGAATYYYYETNAGKGVLATDGYVSVDCPVDHNGIDEMTNIDIYGENAAEELKEAYRGLAWGGMLCNFEDIARDFSSDLDIFSEDYYEKLVMLVEVF